MRHPQTAFEFIGQAKVSGQRDEARRLGFLRDRGPHLHESRNFLVGEAKQFALELARTYQPGTPRKISRLGGEAAYAKMRLAAWCLRESGMISDHDFVIGEKLAYVLSGGRVTAGALVSEQNLLDLEREAFLSPVRHGKDTCADSVHAEEWQAAEKLSHTWRGRMRQAVIVDCVRTAVGKAPRGSLRNTRPDDLAAAVISGLLKRQPPLSRRRLKT